MDYEEAKAWLKGERSTTNTIPQDPFETWLVRIAEADAALTQQAYWIVKAHNEGLVNDTISLKSKNDELHELLKELHALVWGECSALLSEDSGGDSRLDLAIHKALEE